jgi:hypothetical protein
MRWKNIKLNIQVVFDIINYYMVFFIFPFDSADVMLSLQSLEWNCVCVTTPFQAPYQQRPETQVPGSNKHQTQ